MNNTDGLFTVVCKCGQIFAAEVGQCVCGKKTGDLKLNIPEMLNRVYNSDEESDTTDDAISLVIEVFWNLFDCYDIMNDVLLQADVSKLNKSLLVTFMAQTFKYSEQVPAHTEFCNRVIVRMRELGSTEEQIKRSTSGLLGAGKYWEDMKMFGAPTWLSGPNPEKFPNKS